MKLKIANYSGMSSLMTIAIMLFVQLLYAQTWPPVTNFTYYWNPQAGDTVTFQKWDANNDSVRAGTGRIITELNANCVHFNQGTVNHDSVVHYVRIDTIRSNPDIDSIHGNPVIDTVTTALVSTDSVSSTSGTFSGTVTADSLSASNANLSGTLTADSLSVASAMTFTNLNTDSINSTGGIVATNIDLSGNIDITGNASADSLNATKATGSKFTPDTIDASYSIFDTLVLGSTQFTYIEGTFLCSLWIDGTYRARDTAFYQKTGDFVDIKIKGITYDYQLGSVGTAGLGGFPSEIMPEFGDTVYVPNAFGGFAVVDSGVTVTDPVWLDSDTTGYGWDNVNFIINYTFNTGAVSPATDGWTGELYLKYRKDD